MSPEELQRAMQFLLNQQAQFAADLAKNETRWTERFDRITDGLVGLTGIVGQLAASQQRTDEQVRELRESDARLQEQIRATDGHIRDVESHLNIVIEMFERHLREDHGQRPS